MQGVFEADSQYSTRMVTLIGSAFLQVWRQQMFVKCDFSSSQMASPGKVQDETTFRFINEKKTSYLGFFGIIMLYA